MKAAIKSAAGGPSGRKPRLTVDEGARKLTEMFEEYLATLPKDEQDARLAAFLRIDFKKRRARRPKPSKHSRTAESRVSSRSRR